MRWRPTSVYRRSHLLTVYQRPARVDRLFTIGTIGFLVNDPGRIRSASVIVVKHGARPWGGRIFRPRRRRPTTGLDRVSQALSGRFLPPKRLEFVMSERTTAAIRSRLRWALSAALWAAASCFLIAAHPASAEEPAEYAWELVTMRAEFAPRDGAGALTHRGRLWFLGGWNPGDKQHFPRICNNEVWSSADGRQWTLVKPNTFLNAQFDPASDWEGRHTAGYVVYKDKMWIIGGDVNQGHYHFDVWNSEDGARWTYVNPGKPVPWGPRALHYTLVFQDKIWVIGGQTVPQFAKADEVVYRDAWTTTDGVNWEAVKFADPCWSPRGMIGGAAVLNGRIWMLGGGTYDTPRVPTRNFYNDVWSSADGIHWTRHTEAAPWHPRQYHDVAAFDGKLWVLEGYHASGGNRRDVWYSADGVQWRELPNTPWKPRHAASVYVHDGSLWMVAGNNMESDVWRLRKK